MDEFKKWLKLQGYSVNTISIYLSNIKNFNLYIKNQSDLNINNTIINISSFCFINKTKTTSNSLLKKLIENYILHMLEKEYKKETINCFLKSIKAFLKYSNIKIDVPSMFKPEEKLPDAISEQYFKNEIDPVVPLVFTERRLKIKTILWFMFYTGLRINEVVSLTRDNFDLKERTVKIYQKKTKNERIAFYTKEVQGLLELYFSYEEEKTNAFNITKYDIEYIFKRLKPNFPDIKLRPHLFRHSFATMLLKKGVDISIVQKLMGHKNITSTLRYLQTNTELLKEIYDKKVR